MPKQTNCRAYPEFKKAEKIAREAAALTGQLINKAKKQYAQADNATKQKIKKAALIGAAGLVGALAVKKMVGKKAKTQR